MKTPKVQQIPLSVETQFPTCFQNTFGDGDGKRDPILVLIEENIPDFKTKVGFVLAEVLEIQRIGEKAKVFIFSRHATDAEREAFNSEYFALIDKLFKERGWSLSTCHNLYFGDGVTHKIFCAVIDDGQSKGQALPPPSWNTKAIEHGFGRDYDYEKLKRVDPQSVDVAWTEYVNDFNDLRRKIDGSRYFYNLLIPISFHSPPKTEHLRQALGAMFLAFGTDAIVSPAHLMSLYCRLQLFWHYNYSAESAAQLIQKNDVLEKYKDMVNLLQRPLEQLGNAVHSMQRDVRGLSAVLYEPAEGLFRFHKALVDLFDDIKTIKISKHVDLKIRHNSIYSNPTEAALIMALAMWRLFEKEAAGKDGLVGVENATTQENALKIIGKILSLSAHDPTNRGQAAVDKGFLKSILYVCFPRATRMELDSLTLEDLLSDKPVSPFENSVNDRVAHLKAVLFSPFKFHTDQWRPRALELALKDFGPRGFPPMFFENDGVNTATPKWEITDWTMRHDWTPVGYGAVLDFLLKCCAQYRNRGASGSLKNVEVKPMRNPIEDREFFIRLHFDGDLFFKANHDRGKLQHLINQHVLQFPRDWRVEQVTLGNFQKPFVDLCNKMIGLHGSEESFIARPTSGWVVQQPTPFVLDETEHQLLLLERPKPPANKSNGFVDSRFFELKIGTDVGHPGVTLRWFEGPTSQCLKEKIRV